MSIEDLSKYSVDCVKCGAEVNTDYDSVMRQDLLKCGNCGTVFHIFDVYDQYYQQEPLIKSGIDKSVSYAKTSWKVEGGKEGSAEVANKILIEVGFDKLLERIFYELFLYGDSYLRILRDAKTAKIIGLAPLNPRMISVKLGKEIREGLAWTGEREVDGFEVRTGEKTETLPPNDVIHIKSFVHMKPYAPYGESLIRIDLKSLYYLKKNRVPALAMGGKWYIDYLENEICIGMGIPRFLFEKDYAKQGVLNIKYASIVFMGNIRYAQKAVAVAFEAFLFKQALGLHEFKEIPRIKFRKFDEFRLLKEGGYYFSEEIKGFESLYKAGVISKGEYQAAINRFIGKP
jgi:hypothetical protein